MKAAVAAEILKGMLTDIFNKDEAINTRLECYFVIQASQRVDSRKILDKYVGIIIERR